MGGTDPHFGEVNLTKKNRKRQKDELKDRQHRSYIRRRDSGKQKEYVDRTKAAKKKWMDAGKNALRAEDIAKGVFIPVSACRKEPKIADKKRHKKRAVV